MLLVASFLLAILLVT